MYMTKIPYWIRVLFLMLQICGVLTITSQVMDCKENGFLRLLVQITLKKETHTQYISKGILTKTVFLNLCETAAW